MIASAVQDGSSVKVYDERGNYKFSRSGQLVGFTGSTVSIKDGSSTKTYDEKGNYMFSR